MRRPPEQGSRRAPGRGPPALVHARIVIYNDATPLHCPVTAFGGAEDHLVGVDTVEEWERVTKGRFRACMLPGGHFYWLADPAPLLREVTADLAASFPEL